MGERTIKVRLTTDLTGYAKGLVVGTEGVTIGNCGMWSRASDRFVTVRFPGIATLDVLWKSLEIIDEDFLKEREEQQKIFEESLKTAHDVVLRLGPKGGFRSLGYSYTDLQSGCTIHTSNYSRTEAYQIMEKLEAYNIPIEQEKER